MTATTPTQIGARQSDTHVVRAFALWYAGERPREIAASYLRYAGAFGESFSIRFLLKTLFSPWKSITDDYPSKGLNIEAIVSTFFLNITSRVIGFVFRVATIILGFCIQVALLCGFSAYLLLWMLYPLLLVLAIPILITLSI